ncbi:MAG: DNA-binding protein, partial [Chlorobiaceae bacterium]|nr:DNA-binding protein [Chlorobiaceae bacterium]
AQKVGKNRSTVSNFLRLLKLPRQIQDSIRTREISSGHARALINLPNEQLQLRVWRQIMTRQLSVRQTEALVNNMFKDAPRKEKANPEPRSIQLGQIENQLRERLATKVKLVERKGGHGEIHINYFSGEDLDRILELLGQ